MHITTGRLMARCCQGIAPGAGVTKPLAGDDMTQRAVAIKPARFHDVENLLLQVHWRISFDCLDPSGLRISR